MESYSCQRVEKHSTVYLIVGQLLPTQHSYQRQGERWCCAVMQIGAL